MADENRIIFHPLDEQQERPLIIPSHLAEATGAYQAAGKQVFFFTKPGPEGRGHAVTGLAHAMEIPPLQRGLTIDDVFVATGVDPQHVHYTQRPILQTPLEIDIPVLTLPTKDGHPQSELLTISPTVNIIVLNSELTPQTRLNRYQVVDRIGRVDFYRPASVIFVDHRGLIECGIFLKEVIPAEPNRESAREYRLSPQIAITHRTIVDPSKHSSEVDQAYRRVTQHMDPIATHLPLHRRGTEIHENNATKAD